jgi:hypothetical protein
VKLDTVNLSLTTDNSTFLNLLFGGLGLRATFIGLLELETYGVHES